MELKDFFQEIDIERIRGHLEYLCGFEKLSGTEEALGFTEYAEKTLKADGIPFHIYRFPAYLSDPLESTLEVNGEAFPSRPRSFSSCAREPVKGRLFYDPSNTPADHMAWQERMTELAKEEILSKVQDRIVLSFGFDERYAKTLECRGALAWIQIWESWEEEIHEDTVSPVWGTPDLDSRFLRLRIPVIALNRATGEALISRLEAGEELWAALTSETDEGVREVVLPVAEIPGASEDFVLLSDHYDTWYIGAYDNTCANAVTLELARVFMAHRDLLRRSVRIAWWPGHSNGRYMGSTWYCDHFYDDLYRHCMASLNSDLIGGKDSDTVFIRTAGLEGRDFLRSVASEAVPGAEIRFARIGRGADQSFFGCRIPYHINPRIEADPKERVSLAPGGHDWWHTKYDTFDKLDFDVVAREARLLGGFTWRMLTDTELPLSVPEYFDSIDAMLSGMEKTEDAAELVREIRAAFRETEDAVVSAVERSGGDPEKQERVRKLAGGCISMLQHSSGSPYEQDTTFAYGPMHILGECAKLDRETFPDDLHLFSHTTLVRQRNRMVTELRMLREQLDIITYTH